MVSIRRMTKRKLGEILLHEQLVTKSQIEEALAEQAETGELLGQILVRRGYASEKDIAETVATQFSFPYLAPDQYYVSSEVRHLLPLEFIEKHAVIPIDRFGDILTVVVAGPLEDEVLRQVEELTGCKVQIFVSTLGEMRRAIDSFKQGQRRTAERESLEG